MNTKKCELKMVAVPAMKGKMGDKFHALIETTEKMTGFKLTFQEAASYDEAVQALIKGKAQLAWLGQNAFQKASEKIELDALAVPASDRKHESVYRTVFITGKKMKISSPADLKGKKLVLTEKGSTSGDLMPRHVLAQIGLSPDIGTNFSEVIYAGSQKEAAEKVVSGEGDVAALSEINLQEMLKSRVIKKTDIKIIYKSKPIPGAPIVCLRSLPEEVKEKLKKAILEAHEFGTIDGYGIQVEHYDSPREARLDFLKAYLKPQIGMKTIFISLGLILATVGVSIHLKVNPQTIFSSFSYFKDIIGRMMPPDFSDLWNLILSMVETIEIGFLGTVFAVIISVPISLMSAKNVTKSKLIYYPAHLVTTFFRAVPEFIIAMILVISVGFGALPGVLALGLHTMGFLSKFYAEEMEHVRIGPIEAIQSTGAGWFQKIAYSILPQIIPAFMGNTLYILDRNIRMATILGIVGAGGIGYRLQSAFRMFEYREVSAIIIIIFVTIFIIDLISSKIRHSVK